MRLSLFLGLILLFFASIVYATTLLPEQGGTGSATWPLHQLIQTGTTTNPMRFIATSSPTLAAIFATSTTATSTIAGGLEIRGGLDLLDLNCTGFNSDGALTVNALGVIRCSDDATGSFTYDAWTHPTLVTNSATTSLMLFNGAFITSASSTASSDFHVKGHIETKSNAVPVLSSCGTTPTITGSDMAGKVVIGSGIISSCTITFNASWTNAPACVANNETAILLVRAVSTQTTVVLSVATTFQSDTVSYMCLGYE